jgi:hypothetical protein
VLGLPAFFATFFLTTFFPVGVRRFLSGSTGSGGVMFDARSFWSENRTIVLSEDLGEQVVDATVEMVELAAAVLDLPTEFAYDPGRQDQVG